MLLILFQKTIAFFEKVWYTVYMAVKNSFAIAQNGYYEEIDMESYLENLNDKQLEAVTTIDGPLLVLAGAGSGKTTVLTSRIAYILQNTYARPWNILAVTFTNKAANEMRERIERIVGEGAKSMWIGTFHSICVKILRKHINKAGYGSDFVIYDSTDSRTLVKECLKELNFDEKVYPPRSVLSSISKAKNSMIGAEDYIHAYGRNMHTSAIAEVYELYQKKLKSNNALDFDDILMLTVNILREDNEAAEEYQSRFQYILVDEYQDTNNTQYALIGLLAQGYGNICVVGDDDQSIYKFRGANVNNILDFEKDYDGTKKIMLEQNYRSTSNILDAANSVISHNGKRMGKKLWTDNGNGEKISSFTGWSEKDEGEFIARKVEDCFKERGRYNDCAVLYRTNAQSRAIEEALMRRAVPYKVLAGLRFYDRKEIKDIIAYMRVVYNYNDDFSLQRIINEPKRKIGAATVGRIQDLSDKLDMSNFEIISNADMYPELKSVAPRLKEFVSVLRSLRKLASEEPIESLVDHIINDTGYMDMLKKENTIESQSKIENIGEFMNAVREYAADTSKSGELGEFLEGITLVSDTDDYDQNEDHVVLMTIHSAKGLEFPVVFLAGLEEGLFPAQRSIESEEDIEEERRLCYVAITRAKEKLFITKALSRFKFGQRIPVETSRFYNEIPAEYIDDMNKAVVKAVEKAKDFGVEFKAGKKYTPVYAQQKKPPAVDASDFRAGDRVRHRTFGDGTVISAQPIGTDAILVINFDNAGAKRLMAAFAKLEKIV